MEGKRCFGWIHCQTSSGCTQFTEIKQLNELKETCLNDASCIAVSCEDPTGGGVECQRSMLANSCDVTTIAGKPNWNIYFLNSGILET